MNIDLHLIDPPKNFLRPVRQTSEDFFSLFQSIKAKGVLQPILVRPKGDRYEVVDGAYRYTCAKQLHLKSIKCNVVEVDDKEAMILQIQLNAQRPETKDCEFANTIRKVLQLDPELGIKGISKLISKSTSWVRQVLQLRKLHPDVVSKIGHIPVRYLAVVALLPPQMQVACISAYQELSFADFKAYVLATKKNLQADLMHNLREDSLRTLTLPTKIRSPKQVKEELKTRRAALALVTEDVTPMEAWELALKWLLYEDDVSKAKRLERLNTAIIERDKKLQKRKQQNE